MSHPLERSIAALRRRTRLQAALYGISAAAAIVLSSAILLGLVDYFVQFQDCGLRIMATSVLAATFGWACCRYLYAVWRVGLDDVSLAVRVERHFPSLKHKLASALDFLRRPDDDSMAGSAALRRAVIAQTDSESRGLDFSEVLDSRPAKRAALLLAVVCLLAGVLVVLDPSAARTVVARLANPLNRTGWSQQAETTAAAPPKVEPPIAPLLPPTVTIERPATNLFVTPQAVVPLRVAAKDALAVRRINLVFRRSKAASEDSLPLYVGPEMSLSPAQDTAAAPGGERRVIERQWELAALHLRPGHSLMFFATACNDRSQTANSEPRQLTVVTAEELEERLADRQRLLLAGLDRLLTMQQRCRSQVQALAVRFRDARRVEPADADRLKAAQFAQREVHQTLTGPGEGLSRQVRAVLTQLDNNRLDQTVFGHRVRGFLGDIERLDRQQMVPIDGALTAAAKTAEIGIQDRSGAALLDNLDSEAIIRSLAAAEGHQDDAITALSQMLGQWSQWGNDRRFHREISQVIHDQEEIGGRVADVGRRTLTLALGDLPASDKAELGGVAGRQLELARRLNRLLQDMDQAAGSLQQSDPFVGEAVAGALAAGRAADVEGDMRAAASQVKQNQIGRAVTTQKQIVSDLQQMLDRLDPSQLGKASERSDTHADARGAPQSGRDQGNSQASESTPGHAGEPSAEEKPSGEPGSGLAEKPGNKPGQRPGVAGTEPSDDGRRGSRVDMDAMRGMMSRLWGSLPQHAREQMLQSPVEDVPPKYRQSIEAYFRRLAEERPTNP